PRQEASEDITAGVADADGAQHDSLARGHRTIAAQGASGNEIRRGDGPASHGACSFEKCSSAEGVESLVCFFHIESMRVTGPGDVRKTHGTWAVVRRKALRGPR